MSKTVSFISGVIFGVVTLLHLFRLVYGWTVVFNGWTAPLWFSGIGILLAGALCVLNFLSASRS